MQQHEVMVGVIIVAVMNGAVAVDHHHPHIAGQPQERARVLARPAVDQDDSVVVAAVL